MKKLLLLLIGFSFFASNAQETRFGATAGYINISEKASFDGESESVSESGFYVGLVADFEISEMFHIQPEVLYANAEETSFLYVPILAKYYVTEQFNIQAGPQANFFLEDTFEEFSAFGLDIAFGAGFDIDENFFVEARYAFEVTNRIDAGEFDVTDRINTLNVGLGYKF